MHSCYECLQLSSLITNVLQENLNILVCFQSLELNTFFHQMLFVIAGCSLSIWIPRQPAKSTIKTNNPAITEQTKPPC